MNKKKKIAIVRIHDEARKRIKVKAIHNNMSMIDYVDELSKLDIVKGEK